MGPSSGDLGAILGDLGPSWSHLEPILDHLGATDEPRNHMYNRGGAQLLYMWFLNDFDSANLSRPAECAGPMGGVKDQINGPLRIIFLALSGLNTADRGVAGFDL